MCMSSGQTPCSVNKKLQGCKNGRGTKSQGYSSSPVREDGGLDKSSGGIKMDILQIDLLTD